MKIEIKMKIKIKLLIYIELKIQFFNVQKISNNLPTSIFPHPFIGIKTLPLGLFLWDRVFWNENTLKVPVK